MVDPWVLVLGVPSGDPTRKLGGLSLALRLALDAQAAGATALCVREPTPSLSAALSDPRLRIPVAPAVPSGSAAVEVPANWLLHRATFRTLVEQGLLAAGRQLDFKAERVTPSGKYAFAPLEVADSASASTAESALFRSLRKVEDGWTSRYLNRYISLGLSRLLVKTPLRPNQLTVVILGIGLWGAALAARGDYAGAVLGALLFQAQSVLDGCDGEVSRVTHRGSLLGEWLDTIGDDITNYAFFGAAAWGLYHTTQNPTYAIAGIVTVSSGLLVSGLEYRYLYRIGSGDLLKYPLSAGQTSSGLIAAIQPLFKRDTFVFLTLVAALLGGLGIVLIVFALGAVGILFSVLATELRLAREGLPVRSNKP
jgi:1L-myo-inositol 1-phosphate cytidylyltransferase / CDP-L-myo-inositol myo-inositolphosphotransferase